MTDGRRKLIEALVAVCLVVACIGGCMSRLDWGNSVGVDRAASDHLIPKIGQCRHVDGSAGFPDTFDGTYRDCSNEHEVETYAIGHADGTAASATDGGWAACIREAPRFLGGDPVTSRVVIVVYADSTGPDESRNRWYGCDVAEAGGLSGAPLVARKGSLRQALAGSPALAISCGTRQHKGTELTDIAYGACTAPHDAEFAGTFVVLPDSATSDQAKELAARLGCEKRVADYFGPSTTRFEQRSDVGWSWLGPSAAAGGGRTYWCFATTNRAVSTTVKALGDKPLPA